MIKMNNTTKYIDARNLKTKEDAKLTFVTMIVNACRSVKLNNIRDKVSAELEIFSAPASGNEYYRIRIVNTFGKTVSILNVGCWNERGQYAFIEKYCGNVAQVVSKIRNRVLWIALNKPERFTKDFSGHLIKPAVNPAGEDLTAKEMQKLFGFAG